MAKQLGPNFKTRSTQFTTFYTINGIHYARKRSTLTRRRVRTSPCFKQTMISARALGQASKIASSLYRILPPHKRTFTLFRHLTGHAYRLIKRSIPPAQTWSSLQIKYIRPLILPHPKQPTPYHPKQPTPSITILPRSSQKHFRIFNKSNPHNALIIQQEYLI